MNNFIAIYTKQLQLFKAEEFILLDDQYKIVDSFSAIKGNETIYFDYLITDNENILKTLNVEFDNGYVLINNEHQTTIENVYAFGKITNSSCSLSEQMQKILDSIFLIKSQ